MYKNLHNIASNRPALMLVKLCIYAKLLYMHDYCSFVYDFFSLSSPLPFQTLSHPLFNIKKKKKTATINPKLNTPNSNDTTTANPLQHQFNPNTINPKSMKNHHKPNLKSTQNKTPKNLFGKIQINPKPKPLLPWNA